MKTAAKTTPEQALTLTGTITPDFAEILTPDALAFVAELVEKFSPRVEELLAARKQRQKQFDAGETPHFLADTKSIRDGEWKIKGIPEDLLDRRVEITGPVDRKMTINALNSGAKVWMADFEDSHTPTWDGTIQGHINLRDAILGTITYESPEGKHYKLNEKTAVLIVRPRGWHLKEKHMTLHGKPIPGALSDFGLFFFHNAQRLLAKGSGPYFYLPKLESHKEAALWADIFRFTEDKFALDHGTIKATVLIEVITSVFEMEEILYVLRDYIVALNCGRWDYIFSYIKKFAKHADKVLPERGQVVMTVPFLKSYSELLIATCHKRGAFAMGGMAPHIPIKNDATANDAALAKVRADKEREASWGHDGTWVAHPGLVPIAMAVFDKYLGSKKNQLDVQKQANIKEADLVVASTGTITEAGFRNNISVSLIYLESWLRGLGCVPIYNLMEDAATAEISRAQLWQWRYYGKSIEGGPKITAELYQKTKKEELAKITTERGTNGKWKEAEEILDLVVLSDDFREFITLPAYEKIS